jgi:hypothetical protein
MKMTGENRSTRENPVPVPLYLLQIPHRLTRDRTRASAVKGRQLNRLSHGTAIYIVLLMMMMMMMVAMMMMMMMMVMMVMVMMMMMMMMMMVMMVMMMVMMVMMVMMMMMMVMMIPYHGKTIRKENSCFVWT